MNKSEFIGRLTRDNEVSSSASGTTFLTNSIAVDRKFKREGEPTADFFTFTMFGKAAETFEKYTHKGSKVYLSGRMENNSYTKKDGTKANDTRLMVDDFEFLDSKDKSETKADTDFVNIAAGIVEQLPFDDLPFK
mgnify:CR=1 FL=1